MHYVKLNAAVANDITGPKHSNESAIQTLQAMQFRRLARR